MSRSYMKNPGWTDGGNGGPKWAKRQANKKVRRFSLEYIQDGMWYKNLYDRWNIHDWVSIFYSHQEVLEWAEEWYPDDVGRGIHLCYMKK